MAFAAVQGGWPGAVLRAGLRSLPGTVLKPVQRIWQKSVQMAGLRPVQKAGQRAVLRSGQSFGQGLENSLVNVPEHDPGCCLGYCP